MPSRRSFLAASTLLPLAGCAQSETEGTARTRAPLPASPAFADLVRFATLAPNSHNTQAWHFAERGRGAAITPDPARRTPVVDPTTTTCSSA